MVFSSSVNEADRLRALALGACDYIQKPTDLRAYTDVVRGMIEKWVGRR